MVAKHLASLGAAAVFSLLVFIAMQLMIATDGLFEKPDSDRTYLDFVRVDRNLQDTQTKDRRIPDPRSGRCPVFRTDRPLRSSAAWR